MVVDINMLIWVVAYSAFVDFALALYPVLIFAKVQAFSISTRIGLCVLMGFGVM